MGDALRSVLKQKNESTYCLSINPGNGGSPMTKNNVRDIQLRNLIISGSVRQDGFSEHCHLLNFNAVSNLIIENCSIKGFRGDGLYLGSSNIPKTERHNENVKIINCDFDGEINDNRNSITIIDGSNVLVDNCRFSNCTRQDMPASIDIEPNDNSFSVLKNINIRNCSFKNVGGYACISMFLPISQTGLSNPQSGLTIENCRVECSTAKHVLSLVQRNKGDKQITFNNIIINNNTFSSRDSSAFFFSGIQGLALTNNIFYDTMVGTIEDSVDSHISSICIKNNTFVGANARHQKYYFEKIVGSDKWKFSLLKNNFYNNE